MTRRLLSLLTDSVYHPSRQASSSVASCFDIDALDVRLELAGCGSCFNPLFGIQFYNDCEYAEKLYLFIRSAHKFF